MKITEVPPEKKVAMHVTKSERLTSDKFSSTQGNQLKWKHNNIYVKLDCLGYEGIAECLTTWFLKFTDIPTSQYVQYNSCRIFEDGKYLGLGCFSYDYLNGADEITFIQLLEKYAMSSAISYDNLRDFMLDVTGIDVKEYVDTVLCIDSITRNDDRHFGNFGFSITPTGLKVLPIYDNGGGCMSDLTSYPLTESFEKNYASIQAKPFSTKFERQIGTVKRIGVKYSDFVNSMDLYSVEAKRAAQTILRGLNDMRGIAWEDI